MYPIDAMPVAAHAGTPKIIRTPPRPIAISKNQRSPVKNRALTTTKAAMAHT